jgi:hypothetical protein
VGSRINLIGLLGMLALFAGCGEECVEPARSNGPDSVAIFPLAVGNKWIYDDPARSDSVTASIVKDGRTYYVVEGLFQYPLSVRMNDQQQFVVRREDEPYDEYVLFDFGAEPGDRWKLRYSHVDTSYYGIMAFRGRLDSTTVLAGTFRDCYEFVLDPHVLDGSWWYTVAPGTGIVRYRYGGEPAVTTVELVEFVEARE